MPVKIPQKKKSPQSKDKFSAIRLTPTIVAQSLLQTHALGILDEIDPDTLELYPLASDVEQFDPRFSPGVYKVHSKKEKDSIFIFFAVHRKHEPDFFARLSDYRKQVEQELMEASDDKKVPFAYAVMICT